jgi:alkaline phosphatase
LKNEEMNDQSCQHIPGPRCGGEAVSAESGEGIVHIGNGFHDLGQETNSDAGYGEPIHLTGRVDLTSVDTTTPGFHQEALVPLSSETHSGEDISIHAKGPGAIAVQGVVEQNAVFHVINRALGLID